MTEPKTITDIKSSFLRSQIRLLSAPLQVSPTWQSHLPPLPETASALSSATTDEIVNKVNKKVQTHNRLVFSTQSQRHVAEQIDALYWRDVLSSPEVGLVADPNATVIKRNTDLCEKDAVKLLPEDYEELYTTQDHVSASNTSSRLEYHELRTRLAKLREKREELQKRLEGYNKLQELTKPLENAQENIQPNLVTRDGELGKELDRMRVLLARVLSRVGELEHSRENQTEPNSFMSEEQKLAKVLAKG